MSKSGDTGGAAATASDLSPDPFLSSMTFAMGVQRDCDCDECGLCVGFDEAGAGGPGVASAIPADVAEYIRDHKRAKLASGAVTRRQERVLVARAGDEGGASVYRLTLPPGAEPLVEFGNSHRVVLVDRLKEGNRVKSIGRGVVGSGDEERGRMEVGWQEGKAYLVPCNGGRALGWVNEREDGAGSVGGNVVLYMVKITPEAMKAIPDDKEFTDGWVRDILHVFQRNLKSCEEGKAAEQDPKVHTKLFPLSNSDYSTLRSILPPLLEAKGL